MIKRFLLRIYRHLHKNYPIFEGCGPCEYRPVGFNRRRAFIGAFPFPVDLVYTWVDGKDERHAAKKRACLAGKEKQDPLSQGVALFADNEELRYSLRSIQKYAPWVRKIFILTDKQTPGWLHAAHEKIAVVDHKECIPSAYLPTFNSHVIEAYLHRIPGLAEHYIYMNDDFFLAAPCEMEDFFTPNGLPHLFMDWRYSRRYGYAKAGTPHACSYSNTWAFMKKKGYCRHEDVIIGHIPYAATKKNSEQAFLFFEERIMEFSPNKFRTCDEMAFYSHCLPIWAYTLKNAVPVDVPFYYINTARFDRNAYYTAILREKDKGTLPLFFCLNDVGEPKPGDRRHEDMRLFLQALFPFASEFELDAETGENDTRA